MKNTTVTYVSVGAIIIILAIIIIVSQANKAAVPSTATSTTTQSSNQAPLPTVPVSSAIPPSTKTAVKASTEFLPKGNYPNSQIQIAMTQSSCKDAATGQYDQLYATALEVSSFQSFYNPTSQICYMQATGKTRVGTTTIGHIYFRNVSTNAPLIECTDPTGTMTADSGWTCTNKTTGQTLTKAQYNTEVYSYTAQ